MHKKILKGIYPAVISPFTGQGEFDYTALKANIHRWNQYGLRGYVVAGSTGEAPLLQDHERAGSVKTVKETMAEGMILIAGAGRESTAQTIETCHLVAKAGADIALVVTPWYFSPAMSAAALQKHYQTVAQASPIPIMLYSIPKFTGVAIPEQTVIALAQHPNIIGLKDSSGDIQRLANIVRAVPPDFAVFTGHASTLAQALISGASGAVLGVANLTPEICVALFRASEAQNFDKVQQLSNLLASIGEVASGAYGIGGLKYAMTLLQYSAGEPRPPLLSPGKAQKQEIIVALQKAGLLETNQ